MKSHYMRVMMIAVFVAGTLMATSRMAAAACGGIGQMQAAVVRQATASPALASGLAEEDSAQGIVGLWHVNYTDSTGAAFYESFDMWHADGTEWETAYSDPRQGNYCLGVWKKVGLHSVKLNHIAWNFNPDGSAAGYFTISETNTLSRRGDSYTGTFDYKLYDVNGNLVIEVTGTQVATRIKV
ncbi:MAG TPA: hypothetical protein VJO35_03555 [Terriglobales bacterium]|nr:hypothetical protein [Terriglobales bacterium]